ncbi:MAG: putative metal-binding motif-containing protein [Myxococcota bacterium]
MPHVLSQARRPVSWSSLTLLMLSGGMLSAGVLSSQPLEAAPRVAAELPTPTCRTWYPDCDADGYGTETGAIQSCKNPNWSQTPPACTYARKGGDCNDTNLQVNPGALEGPSAPDSTTDGVDNDCDGFVDIDCDGDSGQALPEVLLDKAIGGTFSKTNSMSLSGWVLPSRDLSPVQSVLVDGQSLSTQACSADGGLRFSGSVPLTRGLKTLAITAQDGNGLQDRALTSAIYSDRYMQVQGATVRGSLLSLLNQGSWNILGDWAEGAYDAATIKAELLASNPLVSEKGDADCLEGWEIFANATDYKHIDTEISFRISGGKVRATARIVKPEIWASGWAYYDLDWYCGGWSDRVNMNAYASFSEVAATADGVLSLDANKNVVVSFTNVVVNASGQTLSVDADGSVYDWLIDIFEDDLANELETFVEDELRSFISADLGPLLASELNTLDLSYTLDVEGTPYQVKFTYDTLTVPDGGVVLGFGMGLSYPVDPETPVNPGALGYSTAATINTAPTLGFRFGLDFFNAALHALWEGGSLNYSGTLTGPETDYALDGSARLTLPPVAMPGSAPQHLQLGLGDVVLEVSAPDYGVFGLSMDVLVSASVGVTLTPVVEGSTLRFDVTFSTPEIRYDPQGGAIPEELVSSTEVAIANLLDQLLLELETYLESLTLSYLDVPLSITSITLKPDAANAAMLSLDGQAVYTGP